jgi:hypothetical protein
LSFSRSVIGCAASSPEFSPFGFFQTEEKSMRKILIATALLAATVASSAAYAETLRAPGGPIVDGKNCWVSTNSDWGTGYWAACPKPVKMMKHKKAM